MRAPLHTVIAEAGRARAVAAFTCYDLETAVAAVAAAGGRPLALLLALRAYAGPGGDALLGSLCAVADAAPGAVAVQLDHCGDAALIERALAGGATAVMADAADATFDDNVAFVRAAVDAAAAYGASVEAELGRLEGDEDAASPAFAAALTDPEEARAFCAATGIHCLAVSFGNVHGRYVGPPDLDWDRLDAIARVVGVPLSLHGASGLPDADVRRAVAAGIAKVNVNTELREAYLRATSDGVAGVVAEARLLDLHAAQRAAVERVCAAKLALLERGAET